MTTRPNQTIELRVARVPLLNVVSISSVQSKRSLSQRRWQCVKAVVFAGPLSVTSLSCGRPCACEFSRETVAPSDASMRRAGANLWDAGAGARKLI